VPRVATETTRQIIQEAPEIEAYRLGLLGSVSQFINENLGRMPPPPVTPPSYQVAGLTPLQQEAAVMARQGIGSYQPYMQAGLDAMRPWTPCAVVRHTRSNTVLGVLEKR
jgi:hypothetical protein